MLSRMKSYFWIALGMGAFYFLLSYHIIFTSVREFDLLKKEVLTLEFTFYNVRSHSPFEVLEIDVLRDAGIEDVLIKRGIVSEEQLIKILEKIDARRAIEEGQEQDQEE